MIQSLRKSCERSEDMIQSLRKSCEMSVDMLQSLRKSRHKLRQSCGDFVIRWLKMTEK